ncbi:hypothetical protein Dimus_006731 [Dionaea muscipula]
MAEEPLKPESAAPAGEALVSDVPVVETPSIVVPDPDPVKPAPSAEELAVEEAENPVPVENIDDQKKIAQSVSFREETNVVGDLPEVQKKALDELKKLVQEALNNHEFTPLPPPPEPAASEVVAVVEEEKKEEVQPPAEGEAPPAPAAETAAAEEAKASVETPAAAAAVAAESTEVPPGETEKTEPPQPPAEVIDEKVEAVDDDGAKTVEAIKETIVAVSAPPPPAPETAEEPKQEGEAAADEQVPAPAPAPAPVPEEVFLWGIPLLGDERSDTILLKFLRARDFKVKEALAMIKNTVRWRKEFEVESLLEEDLGGADYEKVVFVHGFDRKKRPVVYNVFGEFQNKELYQNTFSDAEKQKKFLKWLVQFLEKTVRKLDFSPTGISSLVLVTDLKNSPGYGKWDLYKVTNKFLQLLQDNYPEFVAKQVCINVSWWYLAYSWVYISVITPRSKSKFVFAGTTKTAETLFKYISPEHVPVQYGGHSRAGELEFTTEDPVTEVNIKPGSRHTVELPFTEPSVLVWELRVVGWDVTYEAQFVPAEGYTVLVSKPRKVSVTDDPIIADSFKITEPGKVVLSIDNQSSKKKKFLYRSKIKHSD